jgi:hypothetical protein
MDSMVLYQGYWIRPVSEYLRRENKWRAKAVVRRNQVPASVEAKTFEPPFMTFESKFAAEQYALQYARMLVNGSCSSLPH